MDEGRRGVCKRTGYETDGGDGGEERREGRGERDPIVARSDALLLLDRKVARPEVDEEEEAADDGCGHGEEGVVSMSTCCTTGRSPAGSGGRAGPSEREEQSGRTQRLEEVVPAACTRVSSQSSTRRERARGTHLRKSRCGCAAWTRHHALTAKLNAERTTTRYRALWRALYPTATQMHATRPETLTKPLAMPLWPLKTKPRKRKTRRTRPKSCRYFLRSWSETPMGVRLVTIDDFFCESESERVMRRPPMTDRLRRKKVRSKMRP